MYKLNYNVDLYYSGFVFLGIITQRISTLLAISIPHKYWHHTHSEQLLLQIYFAIFFYQFPPHYHDIKGFKSIWIKYSSSIGSGLVEELFQRPLIQKGSTADSHFFVVFDLDKSHPRSAFPSTFIFMIKLFTKRANEIEIFPTFCQCHYAQ